MSRDNKSFDNDETPTTRRDTPKAMQAVKTVRKVQHHTFTYGTLPSKDLFDFRFKATVNPGSDEDYFSSTETFTFGNDERVGTVKLSCEELWAEIVKATTEYDARNDEKAGAWVSSVLSCLGIEWV